MSIDNKDTTEEKAGKINTIGFEESAKRYDDMLEKYRQMGRACAKSAEDIIRSAGLNPSGFHVVQDTCHILKVAAEKAETFPNAREVVQRSGLAFMHHDEKAGLTYSVFTDIYVKTDGSTLVSASLRRTDETGQKSDIYRADKEKWEGDEKSDMAKAVRFTHSLNSGQKLIALFMARMRISTEAIEKNVTRLKPLGVIAETVENAGINVQARSLVNGNSGRAVICLTLPESNTAVTMSSEKEFQIFSYDGCYNTGFSGIRDAVRIGTAHSADEAAEKLLFGKIGSTVLAA